MQGRYRYSVHDATSALFMMHYGPSRVIAIMKFKPQALLDAEMHFATINSLARIRRDLNVAQLNERNMAERIKGVIKQVRSVFRHRVYQRQMRLDTRGQICRQRTHVIRISIGVDYAWSETRILKWFIKGCWSIRLDEKGYMRLIVSCVCTIMITRCLNLVWNVTDGFSLFRMFEKKESLSEILTK